MEKEYEYLLFGHFKLEILQKMLIFDFLEQFFSLPGPIWIEKNPGKADKMSKLD